MWAEALFETWDELEAEKWAKRADEEEASRRAKDAQIAERAAAKEARMAERAAAKEARMAKEAAARRAEHLRRVAAREASAIAGVNTEIEVSKDSRDSARTYRLLVNLRESGELQESTSQRVLSETAEKWDRRRKFWEDREQELLRLRKSTNIAFDESEIVSAVESAYMCRLIRQSVLDAKEEATSPHVARPGNPAAGQRPNTRPEEPGVDGESFLSRLWRKLTS